ncbi:DUF6527 family protein [Rhodococcus sp. 14-2470-1b]
MLALDRRVRPHWTVSAAKPLTLRPSVDEVSKSGRCHYLIRRGKVIWV